MPLVKIELLQGRDRLSLIRLRDTVMDAVVESLQLPVDDRNIRLLEYQPDCFIMKAPYEILIEITLFAGRTKATKKNLFRLITDRIEQNGLSEKEKVFIVLNEVDRANWGVRGGIPADELDLNFNVFI